MTDLGSSLNELEARLAAVQQNALRGTSAQLNAFFDPDTGASVLEDPLDWTPNPTGWEPFSITSEIVQEPDGTVSGGELSTPYGRPQAHLTGNICVLTGVVRRKAGATPLTLTAGTRYNSLMFGLPSGWRPLNRVMLPCLMGNSDPLTSGVTQTAWIEIRPENDPEQPSGRVYFISGTGSLQPGTGYIALQGSFPCEIVDHDDAIVEGSWEDNAGDGFVLGNWYFTPAESPGWVEEDSDSPVGLGLRVSNDDPTGPGLLWNEEDFDIRPGDTLTFTMTISQLLPSNIASVQLIFCWDLTGSDPQPATGQIIAYGPVVDIDAELIRFSADAVVPNTFNLPGGGTAVPGRARLGLKYVPIPIIVVEPPPEPCTPLEGLVLRGTAIGGNLTTSIALPAATQVGDLIVVTGQGNNDGGKNFPLGAGAMTDSRLTGYYSHPSGDNWWGIATDLSPVQIAIPASIASGSNALAVVATFGDSGGVSPLAVGTPVSVTKAEVSGNGGDPIDVAALDARGVIAIGTADYGSGSDSQPGFTGYTAAAPPTDISGRATGISYWTGEPDSPASTWTVVSAYQRYDRTVTLLPVNTEECIEAEPPPTEPPGPSCDVIDQFERAALSPGAFDIENSTYLPWLLTAVNVPTPHEGFHIVSGVLYPVPSSAGEFLTIDTGNANGTYSVQRSGADLNNTQDDRLAFRVSDDGTTGFQWTLGGTVIYFDVNVHTAIGGTYNGGGVTLASGVGDDLDVLTGEMKIVLDDNVMTFYVDDVEVGEVTDSRNNTATRYGFATSDATPGTRGYSQIEFTCATDLPEEPPPDPTGPGPYVTPLAAKTVHEGYGICQHVNFQTTGNIHAGATNQTAIMDRYGQMNVHQMRSLYNPNTSAAFLAAIAGCRDHGVKWNALVAARQDDGTISPSESAIRSRITKMATDHADVIGWIEGINEPNEPSDPNWVDDVLWAQWVIWDEWSQHPELAHVKILSPSMHDTRLDASNGAHWDMYANGEITVGGETFLGKDLCHMAAVHNYPGGSLPDTKRDERIQWVYDAFGEGFPVKLTEWGYTNALGEPRIGGHKVTNEAAAAAYSAQSILDHAKAGLHVLQYEMMDDPNAGNNDTEMNFGQWRVDSATGNPNTTWEAKPSVAAITNVLSALKDPGTAYTPTAVTLDLTAVPAGVRTLVTQKRNGVTTLWMWRHVEMWNPTTENPITVGTVNVSVTDIAGARTITVGTTPVAVNVRLTV